MTPTTQRAPAPGAVRAAETLPLAAYYLLFFTSGIPALLYQIVWQRALFAIYGVNIESVTVVVSVFMLGLGLGSLAGGKLSTKSQLRLLRTFGSIELAIGAFGAVSMQVFRYAARATADWPAPATAAAIFLLLVVPTMLMGATLPLLAAHLVRRLENVGETVASLYCVNTLGSSVACFLAAGFVMQALGESGSVRLAAALNALVGAAALALHWRRGPSSPEIAPPAPESRAIPWRPVFPFGVAMILAGAVGFLSLAYEILWFRLYSFESGSRATCFAYLLAFYLAGIAYGSFAARDICRKSVGKETRWIGETVAIAVLFGGIAAFLLGPAVSIAVRRAVPYELTFPLVFVGAALLGAVFPLLSHAAIDRRSGVGSNVSRLYLANIVGSALGSYVSGYVIMDRWSTRATSTLLLMAAMVLAASVILTMKPVRLRPLAAAAAAACIVLALISGPLFSGMYERLLFKAAYEPHMAFKDLVENRSGVIAVGADETVYGGGMYDGRFNVNPIEDVNGIVRAYAIAGLHPSPKQVLMIGLSSGSWAQVVANHPAVEEMTIVEINPGYLPLIEKRAVVASLLRNRKVTVVIDDGRRWLRRNPLRKFDLIVMNTSFHWRAHTSNVLSTEFLRLVRARLKPGGIHYYNTTSSPEAQATGATEFPYALRFMNFLAVSDSPLTLDRARWRSALASYRIDGRAVVDMASEASRARLEEIVGIPDVRESAAATSGYSIETRSHLLERVNGARLITDDNMGTEWQDRPQSR